MKIILKNNKNHKEGNNIVKKDKDKGKEQENDMEE